MKTLTKITILALILIMATSCMVGGFGIKGDGDIISEDRTIAADFTEIKVSQGIQVYLTQGDKTELSVEADENIIDLLVTEVNGDVLKIYFDEKVSRATKNVYITTNKINGIRTSSGASVKGENTINATSITLKSSSGSGIKLDLDVTDVIAGASSGSGIRLSGTASTFDGDASSGSSIKALNLKTKNSKADVSSGASIAIYVSESLDASASSGGGIKYSGNPKGLNKSKSSGGSVSAKK